jgi:hypothetical protein
MAFTSLGLFLASHHKSNIILGPFAKKGVENEIKGTLLEVKQV